MYNQNEVVTGTNTQKVFMIVDRSGNIISKAHGNTSTRCAIYNNFNSAKTVLRNMRRNLAKMGIDQYEYRIQVVEVNVDKFN